MQKPNVVKTRQSEGAVWQRSCMYLIAGAKRFHSFVTVSHRTLWVHQLSTDTGALLEWKKVDGDFVFVYVVHNTSC